MARRVVCFGELLVRLSPPGKALLAHAPSLDVHVGGAEANVAVSLSLLGLQAAYVTAVPDNALADHSLGELRRHGVDVSHVARRPGRMGLYFMTHGATHRPAEVLYDRAQSSFAEASPDSYPWSAVLAEADWLHVGGITPAVSEKAAQALLHGVEEATARGVRISFDCNYRAKLWGARIADAPTLLKRLCSFAEILFADERDIALIIGDTRLGTDRLAAMATAFAQWPKLKIIATTARGGKHGDEQTLTGIVHSRDGSVTSKTYALGNIVDRIGSGDAYAAGLIERTLAGAEPQAAVEFATAAACLKHSVAGDFSLMRRADIEALLAEAGIHVRR
jgi:2-dehydro-3-deoxygluconokinase